MTKPISSVRIPPSRFFAAKIIQQVIDGVSLTEAHSILLLADERDRAFIQAICYGVCRLYPRLDAVLSELLTKPMKAKDSDVYALLLVGLYQLMEMRVPAHAAVAETVAATAALGKSWARGFVNAILRNYLRRQAELQEFITQDEEAYYAHPSWWIAALKSAWPSQWQAILLANNQHPPFSLRVNPQFHTRDEYMQILSTLDNTAKEIIFTASGVILEKPIAVESLPGFAQGHVSVQDGAAQLASELLELLPDQRVLDACAAPGGKLMDMLEKMPLLEKVIAVEKEPARCEKIKQNLQRIAATEKRVNVVCADVAEVKVWWDGQLFERILLDVPCSASGVVRRHPDIKLLRQSTDIANLVREQLRLLHAVWPLLKPGGLLVYATCSIFPQENVQVMQAFLAKEVSAQEKNIAANWGEACAVGRQILPGENEMDGFYYACLRKL